MRFLHALKSITTTLPLVFFLVVHSARITSASDADPLTQRRQILAPCYPDATNVLNGVINAQFEIAIEKVNRKRRPSKRDLEEALLKRVGDYKVGCISIPITHLEPIIDKQKTKDYKCNGRRVHIPSLNLELADSIFADITFKESPGLVCHMGSQFKMGDLMIGSDKLGHFFAQGYEYIEVYRERGERAALQHGVSTEKGSYGLKANKIYSYGDLAANYCGYVFWRNLTHPSLGHFCKQNHKWVQTRKFCWQQYVNPAWDEAINLPCGPTIDKSQPRVAMLVRKGCIPHCPPLDIEKMPRMQQFYPAWVLPWILHPKTLAHLHTLTGPSGHAMAKKDDSTTRK